MQRYLAAALAASLLGSTGAAMAGTPDAATASHHHAAPLRDAGDRETKALNLLEANGYATIQAIRPVGRHFEATVMKDGKALTVTVDPATGAVTA